MHVALLLLGCAGGIADGDGDGLGPSDTEDTGNQPIPAAGGAFAAGGSTGERAVGGSIFGAGGEVVDNAGGGDSGDGGTAGSGGIGAGGSASGGSSPGTGGQGGGCNVEPANPSSNQTVRNLLCYLYDIYGEKVLSGQQDCHWSASSDVEYVVARTGGKYPAIVGGDFLYDNAVAQAMQSWNAGGLSMIRYHMGRPLDADSYESSLAAMSVAELTDTLTPGTARHSSLLSKFDHAASELALLQEAGVVVLWAPFHEVQPGGWFWWSRGSGEQLKALWDLMFENFVARGLNNLIWLFPFSQNPDSAYYPSPALFDIAGVDTYDTGQPFATLYDKAVGVIGNEMPIPLHETGTIVSPDAMFQNNQAPWVLFSVWCDTYLRANSDSSIAAAYASARTISRSDLPDFSQP